jgi:hypothetical protein
MSTSLSTQDQIVNLISRWLARHIDDGELATEIRNVGTEGLSQEQAQAVDELLSELGEAEPQHGRLEMVARETLEALALGD